MEEIVSWDISKTNLLVEKLFDIWAYKNYISKECKNDTTLILRLSTAGWSGNEEIIKALKRNRIFWSMFWAKSERGGHYTFEIDFSQLGFKTVSSYVSGKNVSRQYICQNKHKFDWINISPKKNLIRLINC